MIEVRIVQPDGRVSSRVIDKSSFFVGREAGCEVVLDDHVISRRHSRVFADKEGRYWVEDLKSKNGTTVNEQPIAEGPAQVREGDRIGVGPFVLSLRPPSEGQIVLGEIETRFGSTSVWHSDQQLSLTQQRLERIYSLFERITGVFDRDELLSEVMNVCMESLRFDRGGIAVCDDNPALPQWIAIRNSRPDASGEFRISRSIVQRALTRAERILVNDVSSDLTDPTASIVSNNIRSAICVPLVYHDLVHGVLYGDRVTASAGYTKEDVDFFAALARQAAMALVNVRLLQEKERRVRFEQELQLARQIQTRLLPAAPLSQSIVSIEAINDPGQRVSGDYYDYFPTPDGRVVVICADVAGKGVPAALLMANLQAAVHVLFIENSDLGKILTTINRLVCSNVEGDRFITGVFAVLDPTERRVAMVNAGHPPPILISGRSVQPAAYEPELPLGVEESVVYTVHTRDLGREPCTLFLYTDGVPDAANEQNLPFGDERLLDALRASIDQSPRDQIAAVRRLVNQFTRGQPQLDDITMVAARIG